MTAPELLLSLATHFSERDWNYTRMHDIKHIRHADDFAGYYRIDRRLRRVVKNVLFGDSLSRGMGARRRSCSYIRATVIVGLRTDKHLPDGILDGGNVITHWEETGEYLQCVQPSVGELLAEFLIAEPEHPHAKKITAELERIMDGYSQRVKAGEVDGRVHE